MGKKDKNKKKGFGIEKTTAKTDKKLIAKQKKLLLKIGEVKSFDCKQNFSSKLETFRKTSKRLFRHCKLQAMLRQLKLFVLILPLEQTSQSVLSMIRFLCSAESFLMETRPKFMANFSLTTL